MFNPEIRVLIACGSPPPEVQGRLSTALSAPIDWQRLVNLADGYGMLPMLLQSLYSARTSAPAGFMAELQERATAKTVRTLVMAGELAHITRNFETAGITPICFKGLSLATLAYGNLALRDSTDLDIYVPRYQLRNALDVLAANGYLSKSPGFKTWLGGACEVALRRANPDVEIDLHWEFSPPYFLSFDAARAVKRSIAIQTAALSFRTLCPEDLLAYLSIHAARECWSLRSVCDVAMLTRNCTIDWDDVARESSRAHSWRAITVGLKLAVDLMRANVPREVWRKIENDRLVEAIANRFSEKISEGVADYGGAPGGAAVHLRVIENG